VSSFFNLFHQGTLVFSIPGEQAAYTV